MREKNIMLLKVSYDDDDDDDDDDKQRDGW